MQHEAEWMLGFQPANLQISSIFPKPFANIDRICQLIFVERRGLARGIGERGKRKEKERGTEMLYRNFSYILAECSWWMTLAWLCQYLWPGKEDFLSKLQVPGIPWGFSRAFTTEAAMLSVRHSSSLNTFNK